MSDIAINFNNYDFFYVKVGSKMPTDEECNNKTTGYKLLTDEKCKHFPTLSNVFLEKVEECARTNRSHTTMNDCLSDIDNSNFNRTTYAEDYSNWVSWNDASYNCYKRELCINKDRAEEIRRMQEDHLGSEQNYKNSKDSYNNELWKTGNLSMGIIIMFILIYYIIYTK